MKELLAIVRSRVALHGWSATAREAGVDRANLHRALRHGSERPISLTTLLKVLPVVGLELTAKEIEPCPSPPHS